MHIPNGMCSMHVTKLGSTLLSGLKSEFGFNAMHKGDLTFIQSLVLAVTG